MTVIKTVKENHNIMIKESIQEGYITTTNIYVPKAHPPKVYKAVINREKM